MRAAELQCFLEGTPKFTVKISVDNWVECRVEVTDPKYDHHYGPGPLAKLAAEGGYVVPAEQNLREDKSYGKRNSSLWGT